MYIAHPKMSLRGPAKCLKSPGAVYYEENKERNPSSKDVTWRTVAYFHKFELIPKQG